MDEANMSGPITANSAGGGILSVLTNLRYAFALSLVANVVLVIAIATGGLVRVTVGPIVIDPIKRDVESRVASLFDDKDQAQVGVKEALGDHNFFQISNKNQTSEDIERALAKLESNNVIVRKLRELSQRGIHPFDGKPRPVAVRTSNDASIASGHAAYCDSDLEGTFLRIWTPDGVGGVQVKATARIECPPERGNLIELSSDDWLKLAPGDARELQATAKVYPHEPPAPRVQLALGH